MSIHNVLHSLDNGKLSKFKKHTHYYAAKNEPKWVVAEGILSTIWDVDLLHFGIVLLVLISEMLTEKEDEATGLDRCTKNTISNTSPVFHQFLRKAMFL